MAKIHELLAAKSNLKGQADTARKDLIDTFHKKRHHFSETRKTYIAAGENAPPPVVEDQLDLQATVGRELEWITPFFAKAIDVGHQIDEGNMLARADVTLPGGEKILEGMPAQTLLELEKRLTEIQGFVATIPTLDPAKGFAPDPAREAGIFKARDIKDTRTKKTKVALTLAPATKEHQAQVTLVDSDEPIGELLKQEWSGLITVGAKADMLERVEDLVRSVKSARARANDTEIKPSSYEIGRKLVDYVFLGK